MEVNMIVKELLKVAAELNISGRTKMKKAELEAAIKAAKSQHDFPTSTRFPFSDDDIHRIGKGSLRQAASFVYQLNRDNGKGAGRYFRRCLRRAGYVAHAGVNIMGELNSILDEMKQMGTESWTRLAS